MGMIKKGILALTSTVMALGVATVPVFATEDSSTDTTEDLATEESKEAENEQKTNTLEETNGNNDDTAPQSDGGPTSEEKNIHLELLL